MLGEILTDTFIEIVTPISRNIMDHLKDAKALLRDGARILPNMKQLHIRLKDLIDQDDRLQSAHKPHISILSSKNNPLNSDEFISGWNKQGRDFCGFD